MTYTIFAGRDERTATILMGVQYTAERARFAAQEDAKRHGYARATDERGRKVGEFWRDCDNCGFRPGTNPTYCVDCTPAR